MQSKKTSMRIVAIALLLVLILGASLCLSFYYGPSFIDQKMDAFVYSDFAYNVVRNGVGSGLNAGLLGTRNILIFGIAFFYALFGVSNLTQSLFGITTFLLTIVTLFLIGKELYGEKAGLISALLFSFFPTAVLQASSSGDDIVMALLVSLAFLSLIIARKRKSNKHYFLSGFLPAIGVLATGETVLAFTFLVPLLLFFSVKEKGNKRLAGVGWFFCGIAVALLLIVLMGIVQAQKPTWFFKTSINWYEMNAHVNNLPTTPPIQTVLITFFPYGILDTLSGAIGVLSFQSSAPSYLGFVLNRLWYPFQTYQYYDQFGYFGYALVLAVAYLLLKREKKSLIVGLWFLAPLLYLTFGTISLEAYAYARFTPRFLLISIPAMVLIVGICIARALEGIASMKSKNKGSWIMKSAGLVILFIGIMILMVKAAYVIRGGEYYAYASVYQLGAIGEKVSTFPFNYTVYTATDLPVSFFVRYKYRVLSYDTILNCSSIPHGSLVVVPSLSIANLTYLQDPMAYCPSWRPVFTVRTPAWLKEYELYNPTGGMSTLYQT